MYVDLVKLVNDTVREGKISFLENLSSYATLNFVNEHISNCIFTGNVAKGTGGGAVYAFGHIEIKSSTFKSNSAGKKGGAVFANKNLYITNSKFTSNKASNYGGAVYFRCHANSGHYDSNKKWVPEVEYYKNLIQTSTFVKNSAAKCGAIYGFKSSSSDKHGAKVLKCTFEANKALKGRDIYGGTASKSVFKYLNLTLKTVKVKKSAKKIVLTAKLTKGKSLIKGKKNHIQIQRKNIQGENQQERNCKGNNQKICT